MFGVTDPVTISLRNILRPYNNVCHSFICSVFYGKFSHKLLVDNICSLSLKQKYFFRNGIKIEASEPYLVVSWKPSIIFCWSLETRESKIAEARINTSFGPPTINLYLHSHIMLEKHISRARCFYAWFFSSKEQEIPYLSNTKICPLFVMWKHEQGEGNAWQKREKQSAFKSISFMQIGTGWVEVWSLERR